MDCLGDWRLDGLERLTRFHRGRRLLDDWRARSRGQHAFKQLLALRLLGFAHAAKIFEPEAGQTFCHKG